MRNQEGVRIEELILHILDPEKDKPQCSESAIPEDSDSRIFQYFAERIEKSSGDAQARPARFVDLAGDSAQVCQKLFSGGAALVSGSQHLAKSLHKIMRSNERISEGDLVVCLYRATVQGQEDLYLALFKIDPTKALRHTRGQKAGRSFYTYKVETKVLPTAGEKIQKCALVRQLDPELDYHMLLLDLQKRTPEGPEVALFFTEQFLGAELALDSLQATKKLLDSLLLARNQLLPRLDNQQRRQLEEQIQGIDNLAEVNVDEWIENLEGSEDVRNTLVEQLSAEKLPERVVTVHHAHWRERTQRQRYRGDHGLRLEIPAGFPSDRIEMNRVPGETGPEEWEIVIRTQTWVKTT